ncbi:MAG: hypothetical protein HOB98_21325 [Gammaproteobacteria bacterium]|nr:hypothetical protein [Gammaproteobacteria bacterium]MBT3867029.1 hypothetical protein [Gammaproteobacteria bacterium]MBT4379380.1 hypothetical protein [Gammaproteobacteria bacterium]MBT4618976.1 hypothetical protein [Gammaproteobacteria bacterium]MBT5197382.1 hypothetical protein [Gammaproteobacteria bacterium]
MPQPLADKSPSLAAGITIVAGTAVAAGMFSLPVVSSGMWFSWSILLLALTWFFYAQISFDPNYS